MPRGKPHAGEFKEKVIKHMREEKMSFRETGRLYKIDHTTVMDWERIYLEEGVKGLYVDRRGKGKTGKTGRPIKLPPEVENDLIAENQRLRAEVDYLKNLHALVRERKQREKKHR